MNMVHFKDTDISAEELVSPTGRMVSHCWGHTWTRIEIPVNSNTFNSIQHVIDWIEENLDGGRFGLFLKDASPLEPSHHLYWEMKEQLLVIGFEEENDAIMFKLLDGHLVLEEHDEFF